MNTKLKLVVAWGLLVVATILSYFVADLKNNGLFVSILAVKKFYLVGYIYLEGIKAHWLYKIILAIGGLSLFIGNNIWWNCSCT